MANLQDFKVWVSALFSRWKQPTDFSSVRAPRHKVEAVYCWALLSRQASPDSGLSGLAIVPGHNSGGAPLPRLVCESQTAEPITDENGVAQAYTCDLVVRLEANYKLKQDPPMDQQRAALILAEVADVLADHEGLKGFVNDADCPNRPVPNFYLIGAVEGLHLGLAAGGDVHDDSVAYTVSMMPFDCFV